MLAPPPLSTLFPYTTLFRSRDVEFVAQELTAAGLNVQIDRWNLEAGHRLWPQIETYIGDPSKSGPLGRIAAVDCSRFRSTLDRKSTRLNSSHANISYAVFCL